MSVRAKMKCDSKEQEAYEMEMLGGTVRLSPVTSGSEENKQFYRYTPGGQLVLSTINQAAFDQFEIGQEYYVDVTPA
jgi:hypothetical protein